MRYDSREFYGNAMAALGALVAALMLVLCLTVARAAAAEYTILVDADGRTGTGCTVPTPKGPFAGVEFAIVTTVATGGLDSLPHNGAVVTLLAVCGCTHRDSYGDIAVTAVLGSIVALVVVIVLGTMFGSF